MVFYFGAICYTVILVIIFIHYLVWNWILIKFVSLKQVCNKVCELKTVLIKLVG